MKIENFNVKGFKGGDFVKVIMKDGSEETIQLERGQIYMGSENKKEYLTGKIIPGVSPSIVVQATPENPEGRGINIEDVEDVISI
ncbi:MAG: hypothetical protein H7Z76_09005 [Methylotenera sp.]|nr:hypothetical protein [Flavobacterium sp.]